MVSSAVFQVNVSNPVTLATLTLTPAGPITANVGDTTTITITAVGTDGNPYVANGTITPSTGTPASFKTSMGNAQYRVSFTAPGQYTLVATAEGKTSNTVTFNIATLINLTIQTQDSSFNPLTNINVTISPADATGATVINSPAKFSVVSGQTYTISPVPSPPSNPGCSFDQWRDTNSTVRVRTVSIMADTIYRALYSCSTGASLTIVQTSGTIVQNTGGNFTETVVTSASGGTGPYSYTIVWGNGNTQTNTNGTFNRSYPNPSGVQPGVVTVTDAASATASVNVVAPFP